MISYEITKENLIKFAGRPVWFQCLSDENDFGWCFIHPESLPLQPWGKMPPGCRLIRPDPGQKDRYSWDSVRFYRRPRFRGICSRCKHWLRPGCDRYFPKCSHTNRYKDFEPTSYYAARGYTAQTFIRQLHLSGYLKEEESCSTLHQGVLPGL